MVKTDIWMPVFIGDYLADTMHLSTEQHGAYLLLLFHLWRKGSLRDDDAVLRKISGLGEKAWKAQRGVLAEFFKIQDGFWQHGRVEKEKTRVAARIEKLSKGARIAADSRWKAHAARNADAMRMDADSDLESESDSDSDSESDSEIRDKMVPLEAEQQVPPLRCASVGRTKGVGSEERAQLFLPEEEQQVPPLRCATVGMTKLVGSQETTGLVDPEKTTDLFGWREIADLSDPEKTTDLVGWREIADLSDPEKTTDLVGSLEITDLSDPEKTTDLVGSGEITDLSDLEKTTDLVGSREIADLSDLEKTTDLVGSREIADLSDPEKHIHLVEQEETTKLVRPSHGGSQKDLFASEVRGRSSQEKSLKKVADPRHVLFRRILAQYWRKKNHAAPEMPWQARDGKALNELLSACPQLSEKQFRQMLGNRARSAVAHGDRVYLWIGNLTRFQEEITVYNKPASAGGEYRSRAEINRNSVVDSYQRAIEMARTYAEGAGQAGAKPAAFDDAGMPAGDGPGPGRCSLTLPANGDYRMAERDPADGPA